MHAHVPPHRLLALTKLFGSGTWIVGRAFRDTVPPIACFGWAFFGKRLKPVAAVGVAASCLGGIWLNTRRTR